MKAAVYLRISQDREGRELGVDRQREDCYALAKRQGWRVVEVFEDNDRGASRRSRKPRPAYKEMLRRARAGDFGVIIAYTTGRLTRRPREHEDLIDLAETCGVQFSYVASPAFDLNTSAGRRVARILAANDAGEAEDTSERLVREVVQRAEQGRYHGGPRAYGFDGVEVRKEEAKRIRKWAEIVLAGGKTYSIATDLNRNGVPSPSGSRWRASVIKGILCNPRVAGLRILHGVTYEAPNRPILQEETWRAVCRALEPKRAPRPTARKWLGTGLYVCARCDHYVKSTYSRDGRRVYQCDECYRSWRAEALDDFIDQMVRERLTRPDLLDSLVQAPDEDVDGLRADAAAARARLTQLAEDFADGDLTAEQLRAATARLRARIADLEAAIADAGRLGPLAPVVTDAEPVARWRELDPARRKAVTDALMRVVLGAPIRGRAAWDPTKFLGGSRWQGDERTWGDYWAESLPQS